MKFSHSRFPSFRTAVAVFLAGILLFNFTGCSAVGNIQNQIKSIIDEGSAAISKAQSFSLSSEVEKGSNASRKSDVQVAKKIAAMLPSASFAKKSIAQNKAPNDGYTAVTQRSSYQNLSASEKTIYQMMGKNVYQVALQKSSAGYYPIEQISLPQNTSETQIRVALTAFMDDNPQVFWLASDYSYGYRVGRMVLQFYSVLSPDGCSAAVRKLSAAAATAVKNIPDGLSQLKREEYVFTYIVNHCRYDDAAVTDPGRWQSFTSYGALVGGLAVCEGYSRAMQLLAGYAGLRCTLIRGSSEGAGHIWNAVLINGAWYHLDVTWCDNSILIYNYFNVTDHVIGMTHTIAKSASSLTDSQICSGVTYNVFLPSCTFTGANYFKAEGVPVSTLGNSRDAATEKAIAAQMKAGKTSIGFYICGNSGYDAMVSGLMSQSPYKMDIWLKSAARLAGKSLNMEGSKYVTDKADAGLTVSVDYK